MVLVWLALCAAGLLRVRAHGGMIAGRPIDDLIPLEHRAPQDRGWLLLSTQASDPAERLLAVAQPLADRLKEEHIPLAPPEHEATAWHDEHALLLVPRSSHDELRRRLTNEALEAAVDGLRARLSSPFFGLLEDQTRRDPLRIHPLAETFGHDPSEWTRPPSVTSGGDLLAADGTLLLMGVRTTRPAAAVLRDVREELTERSVAAVLIGPLARAHAQANILAQRWDALLWTMLAGLTLGWGVAYRRSGIVLSMILMVLGCGVIMVAWSRSFSLVSTPFLPLLMGFTATFLIERKHQHGDERSEKPRISGRLQRAMHAVATAVALLPLSMGPYPAWQIWSVEWTGMICVAALATAAVLKAMAVVLRTSWRWPAPGFVLSPMPLTACLVGAAVLAGGAWASTATRHRTLDHPLLSDEPLILAEATMVQAFFDPGQTAEVRSHGATAVKALGQASKDAYALHALVPLDARRVDSPGDAVVSDERLTARRESLASLGLSGRMDTLAQILESKGLRAAAFGEFLRNTTDIDHPPTAAAALDGPLGPWIEGYLTTSDGDAIIRSTVDLVSHSSSTLTSLKGEGDSSLPLYGPIIADRIDRQSFRDWLGAYSAATLVLGALCLVLGHRSAVVAAISVASAVVTQSAILLALVALGQSVGPQMLPAYLLMTVAAMNASARAITGADQGLSTVPGRELLIGWCLLVAGLSLLVSGEPVWREIGVVISVGAVFATGVGLFIAPGLCWMVRRLIRRTR